MWYSRFFDKDMTIAYYYFSGQENLPELLSKIGKSIFVDPYPSLVNEEGYRRNSWKGGRLCWANLENINLLTSGQLESILLPNTEIGLIEKIKEYRGESKYLLAHKDVMAAMEMAQRTLMFRCRYHDLAYYTYRISDFWLGYIKTFDIKYIISSIIPHSFSDYLFAVVAKAVGIPFVAQYQQGTLSTCFLYDFTTKSFLKNKGLIEEDLKAEFRERLAALSNLYAEYPYTDKVKKIHKQNARKSIVDMANGTECCTKIAKTKGDIARSYDAIQRKGKDYKRDDRKKHVLFLHYQPEATSSPMCDIYTEQRHAVDTIRRRRKEEDLFVKNTHSSLYELVWGKVQTQNTWNIY